MKKIELKPRKMSLNLKRSYVSNLLKTYNLLKLLIYLEIEGTI